MDFTTGRQMNYVPGGPLSLARNEPVDAILLASGFSRRFGGQNKLLAPFCGKPLAQYALELFSRIGEIGTVFFVTAHDELAPLAAAFSAVVIHNGNPQRGQAESVRLGVRASDAEHYLFVPCDQPLLDEATVRAILAPRAYGKIVAPMYAGSQKSPTLFSAAFRAELLALGDGQPPRAVRERHPASVVTVDMPDPLPLSDIDEPKDLVALEAIARALQNRRPLF